MESHVLDFGVGVRAGRVLPFILGVGGSEASKVVLEREVGRTLDASREAFRWASRSDVRVFT